MTNANAELRAAVKSQGNKETGSRQFTRSTADNETPGKTADLVTTDDSKPSVVINELLMYAVYYRDRSAASSLWSVILNYYSGTEIAVAKKQLISSFGQYLCDSNLSTERRSSTQRSASEAEIDDILELLEIVDNLNVLASVQFVAAKYDRLPGYGPEEINVCSLIDRQVAADKNITELTNKVDALSSSRVLDYQPIKEAFATLNKDITTSMQSIQKHLSDLTGNIHSATKPVHADAAERDRQCNVVVFGIPENSDRNSWRNKVLEVLRHAAGHEISVSDAFRLGRYNTAKCRPVLVKLQSVWDRRTVLSGSRKLTDVPEFRRSVYIYPDEPVEVRRRKMFDKMKASAVAEGKQVSITDDVLSVNGADVFSLSRGFIRESRLGVTASQNGQ